MESGSLTQPLLSELQVKDLRLAASLLTGAKRRAFSRDGIEVL